MGKKEDKEKKEKPLDKMTAKELREMGLALGGVSGVHAMNKAELIAAIKEVKGIVDAVTKKASVDIRSIKEKIRALKEKKLQAKESGNSKLVDSLRRRISSLKKKTRRAA
ncbi:MAG: transcription termination factor Rho [Syntrophobacteraceae bacterium]